MKFVVKFISLLFLLSIGWVLLLKVVPVYYTPLMLRRSIEFSDDENFHTKHKWVSLENISQDMCKAVISSEDNLFAKHNGFDVKAIEIAIDEHRNGKRLRGASTISQQTAKNVFTFGSDTWLRKGVEVYYTFLIEKLWGKERIMEVYLNVIECGKGIYGVEAASKEFFGKPARNLTRMESCLIAVCLPNPFKMHPDKPSKYVRKRQSAIYSLSYKVEYPDWLE
ncbi:MAG: monofunctional biosynthetic peptidoglycan transglycosylase [Bacteroidales bacterium]|nr:monofunctional biosynthetic peptidoglycan transglycosylase [Bacteroidales bacterium]